MESLFYYVGFFTVIIIFFVVLVAIFDYIVRYIFRTMGSIFSNSWILIDYAINRKKYKQWKKEQSERKQLKTE